ncbi:MAG: sodium:solute symporter family transporter [Acidobacteriota bacterium]
MNWIQDHWALLILLAVYTALLAYHAWTGKRETQGLADFYVGGRSMGGVAVGLSFFATFSSTNSFVGFSGQSYRYGLPWLLVAPFLVIFCLIAWIWIAPRLREFT